MKLLKWTAVTAMFVIGFGAVYVSTVGLGETQAATTDYLTQAASRADIARTSAATGTVAPSESYALAFGEDARIAATTTTAAAESSWLVDSSLVAIGDRVTAGQTLATASTADIDDQIERATQSLMLAQMTLAEADKTLKSARTDTRQQLTDAHTAVDAAQLGLKSAKVQRSEADTGNPKRSAKIAVIRAQDSLRAAKRLRDDLKAQLDGNFPDQTIAVGQAQESVADLESQLADLTAQHELARIVAPVDGVISAVNIEPGFLAPASDAIRLDSATLEVIAAVVESDVSALELGQPAIVSIDALGLDAPGTVTSIAPSTEGGTSNVVTFPVAVTLTDPDPMVKPGMSTDVAITIAEAPDALAVPAVALRGRQGAYSVQVANANGGIDMRPVEVGLVTETLAEIQSGVSEGESIVVGTDADRTAAENDDQSGFGGPGGLGGGFRGFDGGGGGRRGGGGN